MSDGTGKTSLAKLATSFAIGFVVSLGLCGVNFLTFTIGLGGGAKLPVAFVITGYVELAGMAICAVGLLIVCLVALVQAIYRRLSPTQDSPKDKP